jgi:septum formation protein
MSVSRLLPASHEREPRNTPSLILASGSPRRRELLAELGIPFTVVASEVSEELDPALVPSEQAVALAERKARAVAANLDRGLVLGADTIVVLDGDILGKPEDDADARRMLRRLSGRPHEVITGIALIDAEGGDSQSLAVKSTVQMRHLNDDEIAEYLATGEPRDKAGAYAIQGRGSALIAHREGSFTNVVGLPLDEVGALLRAAGFPVWRAAPGSTADGLS